MVSPASLFSRDRSSSDTLRKTSSRVVSITPKLVKARLSKLCSKAWKDKKQKSVSLQCNMNQPIKLWPSVSRCQREPFLSVLCVALLMRPHSVDTVLTCKVEKICANVDIAHTLFVLQMCKNHWIKHLCKLEQAVCLHIIMERASINQKDNFLQFHFAWP